MRSQHFEALVEGLRGARPGEEGPGFHQWVRDVETMAGVYDKLFPRFSRRKFLRSLGLDVEERPRGVRTRVLKQLLVTQERLTSRIEELEHMLAGQRGGGSANGS